MLLLISITAGLRASEVRVTGDMFLGMRCECVWECVLPCVYVFVPAFNFSFHPTQNDFVSEDIWTLWTCENLTSFNNFHLSSTDLVWQNTRSFMIWKKWPLGLGVLKKKDKGGEKNSTANLRSVHVFLSSDRDTLWGLILTVWRKEKRLLLQSLWRWRCCCNW